MILFDNGLIKLDYNPTTDILFVDMPSVNYSIVPEFRHALETIVENVRTYDVKKLLVEARKSVVDLQMDEYLRLVMQFNRDLNATRLQKGARIVSANNDRENLVKEAVLAIQPTYQFQTFTEHEPALLWLAT